MLRLPRTRIRSSHQNVLFRPVAISANGTPDSLVRPDRLTHRSRSPTRNRRRSSSTSFGSDSTRADGKVERDPVAPTMSNASNATTVVAGFIHNRSKLAT
ncbi:hypothetical protein ZOD2009_15091 [Haladaptatus paucihalophilus DX253]|uniref:Uncharacterized protein n=1 Tax=Haladaptatus paucihalophilus DX253 TaxID=797209 RepID=E7QW30_HALPU|nr:hypothetical protein ZOD2009_15091 [Haladaptatus paucihalophilus DX253]